MSNPDDSLARLREQFGFWPRMANDIILLMDMQGNILAINDVAERAYGWNRDELLARNVRDLRDPATLADVDTQLKAAGDTGVVFETGHRRRDGSIFPVEVSSRAFEYGGRRYLQSIVRDISRRKRIESELAKNLEQQQALNHRLEETQNQLVQSEKMASLGQLAAGVAHELNNPIGFVYSNMGTLENYLHDIFSIMAAYDAIEQKTCLSQEHAQIMRMKKDKDYDYIKQDIFQLMTQSKDGLMRMRKIVQDLKDFSHVGDDGWKWADLHQGLESTLNIVWNELKYKCQVNKEYGELPQIYCMASQLNQVFMNMLMNSAQAIETKGVITIRTGAQDDEVWVEIEDTGKGIAPENINRIFDPFFTTKPVGVGTGLGLSLSYGIVRKHQGRIEVHSEVGKGTRMRIWLPVRMPETAPFA